MSDDVEIKDPAAVLAALERAKSDAKKNREELEALQAEHATVKEQLDRYQGDLKNVRLRAAIKDAGADPERVMRYLKVDDINLTESGLEGFDNEFTRVKTELPELFDTKRRVGGNVEMFPESDANHVKSVSEIQAAKLMRRVG